MAVDVLVTPGARASTAMVLPYFSQMILASTTEGLSDPRKILLREIITELMHNEINLLKVLVHKVNMTFSFTFRYQRCISSACTVLAYQGSSDTWCAWQLVNGKIVEPDHRSPFDTTQWHYMFSVGDFSVRLTHWCLYKMDEILNTIFWKKVFIF